MHVEIRPFRAGDLPTLEAITVEAFDSVSIDQNIEEHFGRVGGRDWKWRKARAIVNDARLDADGVFVVEVDGQIAGYVSTWCDREAGVGNIPNLAVSAQFRGHGLGRKLIMRAIEHFRRQGLAAARIETLDQNPIGQHLYPACGFTEVARQIHYFRRLDEPPPPHDASEDR